ncbi:transglycosylase SLT domain-containing protein [Citreimonas sp.]|uniref:transglycosylase SLT domain-containing protein n=1 Tax=Citreimonas sp. TaxID=3036715 RepID=UPI0035C80482
MLTRIAACTLLLALTAGCSYGPATERPGKVDTVSRSMVETPLHPNETPALRASINKWADHYEIPRSLVHRLAIRESTHRPGARNGPYYGLLQILPATARSMGFQGQPTDLLQADVNLQYALKYLRGAYLVSEGDPDEAIFLYAKGYYPEAKRAGLLEETGLR